MADTRLNQNSSSGTLARSFTIGGGEIYPTMLTLGTSALSLIASDNPLPVGGSIALTAGSASIGTVAISGTVPVTLSGSPSVNIGSSGTVTLNGTSPVSVSSGSIGATIAGTVPVTLSGSPTVNVGSNGTVTLGGDGNNSITVDAPVGTPAFVRLSDGTAAITTLAVSLASVPSHAVSGTVTANDGNSSLTVDSPVGTPAFVRLSDGTIAITTLAVSLAGTQAVSIGSAGTVTVNGTVPVTLSGSPPISGSVALLLNTASIGTVQPGNTANTTPWLVTEIPATSGGCSQSQLICGSTTNATVIKASPGQIFGLNCANISTAAAWLKIYDKATSPTVGSDTPKRTMVIPSNTNGAGFVYSQPAGLQYTAGISIAVTNGPAVADTTILPQANAVVVNVDYK